MTTITAQHEYQVVKVNDNLWEVWVDGSYYDSYPNSLKAWKAVKKLKKENGDE